MIKFWISLAAGALLVVFFAWYADQFTVRNSEREMQTLQEAVDKAVTSCYAETGAYPESLKELRENYDLLYDENKYFVDYQVRGANLRPEITILVKGGKS